ncbi:MAG: DUF1028 domain-containing protein [Spirochaetota bacterium]
MPRVATFTIVATDLATGDIGVATASRYLAVGALVPHVRAGVAAVATQSVAHPALAASLLSRLAADGEDPGVVVTELLAADPDRELRQVAIVTADGTPAAFTGSHCVDYAGERSADTVVCAGNTLAGPEVLDEMMERYHRAEGALWDRLLAALSTAGAAGGDKRGKQAAAIRVDRPDGGYRGSGTVVVDLRVDDHHDPIGELFRLYELRRTLDDWSLPATSASPSRESGRATGI